MKSISFDRSYAIGNFNGKQRRAVVESGILDYRDAIAKLKGFKRSTVAESTYANGLNTVADYYVLERGAITKSIFANVGESLLRFSITYGKVCQSRAAVESAVTYALNACRNYKLR